MSEANPPATPLQAISSSTSVKRDEHTDDQNVYGHGCSEARSTEAETSHATPDVDNTRNGQITSPNDTSLDRSFWDKFTSALNFVDEDSLSVSEATPEIWDNARALAFCDGCESASSAENDSRIPHHLRPYVTVGVHGGLIFKPAAVLDVDPANPCVGEAYSLVAADCLGQMPNHVDSVSEFLEKPLRPEPKRESENENTISASQEPTANSEFDESDQNQMESRLKGKKFNWMESESRRILLNFGEYVRERIVEREETEREEAESTRARAAAASERVSAPCGSTDVPEQGLRPEARHEDPIVWAAQQEATMKQVLRSVRAVAQNRRKGSSGISGSAGASSSESQDSSFWSFLMPRATKPRSEAAAEMARARMAAAAAAEVMRDDKKLNNSNQKQDGRERGSASRRTRSAPPGSLDSRWSLRDFDSTAGADEDGNSNFSGVEGEEKQEVLPLDDFAFFARARSERAERDTDERFSIPYRSRAFSRPMSERRVADAAARASPRKKRVSFSSNTVYNYQE